MSRTLNLNIDGSDMSQVSLRSPILLDKKSGRSLNTLSCSIYVSTILVIVHYRAVSVEEVLRVD